jgi:hypothetical protein
MWVATQDLPRSAAHPFYTRLNQILDTADFDARCGVALSAILRRRPRIARIVRWLSLAQPLLPRTA